LAWTGDAANSSALAPSTQAMSVLRLFPVMITSLFAGEVSCRVRARMVNHLRALRAIHPEEPDVPEQASGSESAVRQRTASF
jgi:hypothetical protein